MNTIDFLAILQGGGLFVADGATGTNLQQRGLGRGQAAEAWVLEQPDLILHLHRDFLAAGAQILLTCTFGATRLRLHDNQLADHFEAINQRAVELARQASTGTPALIAGSVGPTGQLLEPFGPLSEEAARQTYAEQVEVLTAAGVDLLVIETQFDLNEGRAAVQGARQASSHLPLVISFSFDRGKRTMMGVRPRDLDAVFTPLGVDALGINCGRSLEDNLQALQELKASTRLPIWFKPNAGLPKLDDQGQPVYSVTPHEMGAQTPTWIAAGAQVVGGCCGTSPSHLASIAAAVPRRDISAVV